MQKNNLVQKINELDDNNLRTLIISLAGANGIPSDKISALTSDIPKLKSLISTMSDDQLTKLISSFGSDIPKNIK